MSTTFGHRRRAQRFAQLLDEADGGRRQHLRTPYDQELTALVSVRHQLVNAESDPHLDPEFRTGLRAMLVATAEREGIGATATPADPDPEPTPSRASQRASALLARLRSAFARGPRARTAVLAGVAIGVVAFTGISTASENALPGDALYGVKRSTERAQLALASSEVGRGQLYLEFAENRLHEARATGGDLDRVLADMDRDTSHGIRLLAGAANNRQDRNALDEIDAFVTRQRDSLQELSDTVPGHQRSLVAKSLALLDTIEERAAELRDNLEGRCPSITSVDDLGPVPTDCQSLTDPTRPGLAAPESTQPDPASPPAGTLSTSTEPAAPATDPTDEQLPSPEPTVTASPQPDDEAPDQPSEGGNLLRNLLGVLFGKALR